MREITTHAENGLNSALKVFAVDKPGAGGANHVYEVYLEEVGAKKTKTKKKPILTVSFQKGPVQEAGFNGASNEALLAIVRDRLECFQAGDFACYENAAALEGVKMGMDYMKARTLAREARGVEGTHEV